MGVRTAAGHGGLAQPSSRSSRIDPDRLVRRAGSPAAGGHRGRRAAGARYRADVHRAAARGRAPDLQSRGPVSEAAAGSVPHTAVRPLVAWSVLAVASVGVLLSGAELMVVAIALPSIVVDFGGWADLARVSWIINAYLLAFVVAMPLAGRAADMWGAARLYVGALLLFSLGSLASGLSPLGGAEAGLSWLIGARVVQGFGGGALVPLSMRLAAHLFEG